MRPHGRHDEFTAFYLSYLPQLIGIVSRILKQDAEGRHDVLQDVWVKGARAWPPRHPAFARSWLGRIAINAALERERRRKRSVIVDIVREDGSLPEFAIGGPTTSDFVLVRQVMAKMGELEARIPRQIAAMKLVHVEGLTYLEASRRLGVAEGTVKSNASKAVDHVRASLNAPKAA